MNTPAPLLKASCFRGYPFTLTLRQFVRGTDGSVTYTNLTSYSIAADAKAISNPDRAEDERPGASVAVAFSYTAEAADPQTGDNLGAFTLSLTGTQTNQAGEWYIADVRMTPPGGDPEIRFAVLLRLLDATTEAT